MADHFTRHYTREEARQLLPQIQKWLVKLEFADGQLKNYDQRLSKMQGLGDDLGGATVNSWVKAIQALKEALAPFQEAQIQVKDVERGLIDFPTHMGGKEVFLCWEKGEEDVEFWHDLESGYTGRERLGPDA